MTRKTAGPAKPPEAPPDLRIRDVLIGQEEIFDRMVEALREDRLAHSYLLLGAHGSGRTRSALAMAQILLCTGGSPPCGTCAGCRKVVRGRRPAQGRFGGFLNAS